MEIDCDRLRHGLLQLKSLSTERGWLDKYVRLEKYSEKEVDTIVKYLARNLLDPQYTQDIATTFPDLLFVIVVHALPIKGDSCDWGTYLRRCVALSMLVRYSPEIARYAVTYFSDKESPFRERPSALSKKKPKSTEKSNTDFEVVQCCYYLLVSNPSFYKDLWDWSIFVDQYSQTENEMQKLYYNHALAILFNMTQSQLKQLNEKLSDESVLGFYNNVNRKNETIQSNESPSLSKNKIIWNFSSKVVTNIEGILLPIYNSENAEHYSKTSANCDKMVRVDSTRANLKNVAMGLSSNKAICFLGPVGCGKTTLVEYLATKTGRIVPKRHEEKLDEAGGNETNGVSKSKSQKRKIEEAADFSEMKTDDEPRNGFLRIQLGDQTDSKVLLGQYRCTDVPGEFIWLPGVLTQAVMNGYWLLLEDLDLAPQDTCTILSTLLENGCLSVPGFRDSLKISPGFQLFITVRSNKTLNSTQKTTFSLLEKYFYIVNIVSLSRNELCQVVSVNYPKLATIANRIVDVYLLFSSGGHTASDIYRNSKFEDSSEYTVLPTTNTEIESFSEIVNSGRLVSTRDLMKLCERSHAMFSATSAEYAYFVFQNAADIFCSYLPHSMAKTKLITSIGARLSIIQSRCEYFSNDYKPDIEDDNCGIKVGRTYLEIKLASNSGSRKRQSGKKEGDDDSVAEKKSKLGEEGLSYSLTKKDRVTFSFTRLACCLLERIGVCVNQAEPILLVGETGVGKTSCVQYLAAKTNHKLVVVNMNNQSDVSDLVGGFKPVDLSYVVAPIRQAFELLFRNTFNENKNEKFLLNVSACYNRGDFAVLIKLMLKIADTVFKRSESNEFNIKTSKTILNEWKELHVKLTKLNSQLIKSINVSFAFITGSLVNCIKNGDWVLLDEINLASDETLECLSTILERDGSIVLLEKGDLMPVKRHPDFRIFACMNPRTDVGKKDLPTGIRNRFTEFFVDELSSEMDLRILIGDYLRNTGISSTKISAIVKLYGQLKTLSLIELNDGLGNKPIFSLRTLCRSLTICARNLCGSIDRNLYESFCLSFLTQLDNDSHKVVLNLIKSSLLSNSKAILSQEIPRPGEDFINFEGYWIEQGSNEVVECPEYILTDTVRENLKDVARIISIGKLPILLQGPTSAGKTSLIEYIAKMSGNHCLRINNHEHTDLQEYIGTYISDNTGKLVFKEGILVQAMRNGYWMILDELNLASTDILEALNRVLDDNRELFIPETQVVVKAHPKFMLFATQNPPGLYGGRKTLSRAFKNRFIELHFSEIPRSELEIILEKRCQIPKSYSQKMVKCMSELQVNRATTSKNNFTLRDLFRWGNRYTWADKKLLANNLYDWNQHLVDEGYLVLSAKVRTEVEIEIIEETLFKNFRKKVDLNNLYSLHEKTSWVTRDIVESLLSYTERSDIIWTQNMTRMAVLTAKALQFREPVLLVGPTGCGKTTICQILADIQKTNLRILNCHMHTEGADFLGGLRPCRDKGKQQDTEKNASSTTQLFEWVDGPLIHAMQDGSFFMVDEISLAEDSVLERLNSVLETSRTIVLAEKGGALSATSKEFIIQASEGFQFLATMNPGGDFGKKELSPALRNRFTEVWCQPSTTEDDLIRIAGNILELGISAELSAKIEQIARVMVRIVFFLKNRVDKFKFSVRDILAWANYVNVNSTNTSITFEDSILYGMDTIFLDSLEMLPYETEENIAKIRIDVKRFAVNALQEEMGAQINAAEMETRRGLQVAETNGVFGIKPFFIATNPHIQSEQVDFQFNAPTTQKNLLRLLSALSLNKAILLEGPPGVGKTSTVENLARAIGYHIVRINLCEHTDLADLFGTDLPAEEKTLDMAFSDKSETELKSLGSFVWRDGPLLSALKSKHTWILLDELNLAPQSVLEGLNAILDHRGEVFIPELNKTFTLGQQTRIFACQNPLRQGGGRKGLPQSFLNRFTKVYLSKLHTDDLLHVVNGKYRAMSDEIRAYFQRFFSRVDLKGQTLNLFDAVNSSSKFEELLDSPSGGEIVGFDLLRRMVRFSERLNDALSSLEFGVRGGPYEINLRDILRWCEFLFNPETGFIPPTVGDSIDLFKEIFNGFLLVLFERMKLVYYQRMRSESDRAFIQRTFSEVFNCNSEKLNALSEDVSLYWTDSELFLNDIVLKRNSHLDSDNQSLALMRGAKPGAIILNCQLELLKNVVECVHMEKTVILSGPTNSGKTKVIDTLCSAANESYETEIIEDSVTGSFQQIDLNRHLEEVANSIETVYLKAAHQILVSMAKNRDSNVVYQVFIKIMKLWNKYSSLSVLKCDTEKGSVVSEEMLLFKNRIKHLRTFIRELKSLDTVSKSLDLLEHGDTVLNTLAKIVKVTGTLNTGGHFEWVDSKIVKSLKTGGYICLEHVNFCSPAILDRLNPVFEPNGSLLLSEKGVTVDDESEIVHKHADFRAFLTIDPKHGELSRAMRNRCVELDFSRLVYTENDLRQIVYMNGIRENYMIDTLIRVYELCKSVTELDSFNVSHLIHCAYLVSCNKRAGLRDEQAVYNSSMEVYVFSSTADLLGYGVEFYQNKLRDIIVEECKEIKPQLNIASLENTILRPNEMNQVSLIKMQCEPLICLLKCYPDEESIRSAISCIFPQSKSIVIKSTFDAVKHYFCVLYAISSVEDLPLRYSYFRHIIESGDVKGLSPDEKRELQALNKSLHDSVADSKSLFPSSHASLPWNSKLLPRIRSYSCLNSQRGLELGLNAKLLAQILIEQLTNEELTKLNKMSALGYSQALSAGKTSDNFNNTFLQQLWPFIKSLHEQIGVLLRHANLTMNEYSCLLLALLWFDRFYKCSKNRFVVEKQLDLDLMDKMLLHFKWIKKKLLKCLRAMSNDNEMLDRNLEAVLRKIEKHLLDNSHPLNILQKKYAKQFTSFAPYYAQEQVDIQEYGSRLERLTALVPCFGSYDAKKIQNILKCIDSMESEAAKNVLARNTQDILSYIGKVDNCQLDESVSVSEVLKLKISEFLKNIEMVKDADVDQSAILELLDRLDAVASSASDNENETIVSWDISKQILPLKDLYGTKAFLMSQVSAKAIQLNDQYFNAISTSSCLSRQLFNVFNSDHYRKFKMMWHAIMSQIANSSNSGDIEPVVLYLSSYYRNFSTFNRVLQKSLQYHNLSTVAVRNDILALIKKKHDISAETRYTGPRLTNCLFLVLFHEDGNLKPIELSELIPWKKVLNDVRQIVWNNSVLMSDEFNAEDEELRASLLYSKKLVLEVEYIERQCEEDGNDEFAEYNYHFQGLVKKLKTIQTLIQDSEIDQLHPYNAVQHKTFFTALLNSLIGAIELCIFTFLPLVDPVEKNRLKKLYSEEDANVLNTLLSAYDLMRVVMCYKHLGDDEYQHFASCLANIQSKLDKFSQKVALRPELCRYNKLVEDIKHFLKMNCMPASLLKLINDVVDFQTDCAELASNDVNNFLLKSTEMSKKLELWIVNSQRFLFDVKKNFAIYYNDFTEPLECAILMTQSGFGGLRCVLTQQQHSLVRQSNASYCNINENGQLCDILQRTFQFPSVPKDEQAYYSIAKKLDDLQLILRRTSEDSYERMYLSILKATLLEVKNRISVSCLIEDHTFHELQTILAICSKIWKDEEERKRKQQIEDDSLYVNKTLCETENEEEIELEEIQRHFPTNVDDDFGEFIVQDTLEQVKVPKKNENAKKVADLIAAEEYQIIAHTFVYIMECFARIYYYKGKSSESSRDSLDYITPFKMKLPVFSKLILAQRMCLNSALDHIMHNTYGFIVGLQQEMVQDLSIADANGKSYNFYKDSNIPEIIDCTELMERIVFRTKEQLALYPEHAVLLDIIRVIDKIKGFASTSPVARFNTGFQLLRQKLALWNEVAHKRNHFRDLEEEAAVYVQKWTRLELQFWRNCLMQTFDRVQSDAYRYWFFLYNLLHEYLDRDDEDENKDSEVIGVIRQFVESSNYADFSIRMRLLRSFEIYLHYIHGKHEKRKNFIIATLRNTQLYFNQFANEIDDSIKSFRTPIEKKLREFVKIESYNKDLSYFSMKSNVARVHRNLNKFLKEYEALLRNKISPVFQQKENASQDYNLENDKGVNLRYEPRHKYYMLDAKHFLAPQKLKNIFKEMPLSGSGASSLLVKCDKLFATSRTVVRDTIQNTQLSMMIHSLDSLLTDQIETCEYLRKLEVDRSQEKPKQKAQAKHILSQKKKGLSDLYKTLANLGISYKTGLMELSLKSDFTDFSIQPFCVRAMLTTSKGRKLDQNLIYLNDNLDLYFAKCVFKLKLLQNVMLTPNAEMGPMNIDRMKGFAIDMFLLVQKQRKVLSESIKDLFDLRKAIEDIEALINCAKSDRDLENRFCFEKLENEYAHFKHSLCEILSVIEQYTLLFKCLPHSENMENSVLADACYRSLPARDLERHTEIVGQLKKIASDIRKVLQEMVANCEVEFLSAAYLRNVRASYDLILARLATLRNEINGPRNSSLPIVKPLHDLLNGIKEIQFQSNLDDSSTMENIDNEIENAVHSVLISLQKVYKKYKPAEEVPDAGTEGGKDKSIDKDSEDDSLQIQDNHLKEKIHKNILSDIADLRFSEITEKLSNILLAVKYTGGVDEKLKHVHMLASIQPILEQFNLMGEFYLFQQLGAHKVSAKMLSIILTVFIELGTKGFCVPPDLLQDEEEGEAKQESKKGEGFGLEDGTGENDVSDKIESEDQLDDAKRPEDRKDKDEKDNADCKEEKGIDMSEDFDANMQDVDKKEDDDSDDDEKSDEEHDKQMGETEAGAEKLDDQIWGSDDEKEEDEEENEMSDEEGAGNKEEEDKHNDTGAEKDSKAGEGKDEQADGLDATNENDDTNNDKKKQNEIDNMKDPQEQDEEQVNPYHNELEEPPEAEQFDMGDCNVDEDNGKDEEDKDTENPFEIDKMKEGMDVDEDGDGDEEKVDEDNNDQKKEDDQDDTDSEPEPEVGEAAKSEADKDRDDENREDEEGDQTEDVSESKDDQPAEETEPNETEEKKEEKADDDEYAESKDQSTKEENVHSMQDKDTKGSNDQVVEQSNAEQDSNMDAQDTGEEKENVGQAENDATEGGHQGVADTKEKASDKTQNDRDTKERKKGNVNEERTLGKEDKSQVQQLKTVDKLKEDDSEKNSAESDDKPPEKSDEYQHVREAKDTDKTTLDNATEDQSKQIQHLEDEDEKMDDETEASNELMDAEEEVVEEDNTKDIAEMESEKMDQNSNKPSKKSEKTNEVCETNEQMEVEGELTETHFVPREDTTTAHCNKDLLRDTVPLQEPSTADELQLRKMYQDDLLYKRPVIPQNADYEVWQSISNKMSTNARELCEQLRLILEPTKCTRLKGDYRTGRRINMRKIIPYIASQFRKDKIWLRRTKPSQRDYKITIAIDDSKSMHHNNSKRLTLEAISLVSQALTLLESGKLSIVSFGESPHVLLHHTEQFDGPKLVQGLEFAQNQSKIAELMDFIRTAGLEEGMSSDNKIFENLLLVISDGRNIFSEGEQKVKNAIKLARLQRIFIVYVIIDNPENKHSILDIRMPQFSSDRKTITMRSYLDTFPFPYYVIVRDLGQLPLVLSEAMRQWFELVNSEQ